MPKDTIIMPLMFYTRTHVRAHTHTTPYTHMYARARARTPPHASTHAHTHTHARTHKHARTHTHTHAGTRARTHTHTHNCDTCTLAHEPMHAHCTQLSNAELKWFPPCIKIVCRRQRQRESMHRSVNKQETLADFTEESRISEYIVS